MASIEKRVDGNGETSYRVKVRLKGYPVQSSTFKRINRYLAALVTLAQ